MLAGTLSASEQPLEAIAEKPLIALYQYWLEAGAGRAHVRNSDLRPERFAAALPYIAIIEKIEQPRAGLRIRLCGSDIENKDFGITRGAFLEDFKPDWYRDHLLAELGRAFDQVRARHQRIEATVDGKMYSFTRLILPLSRTGDACDMLLTATIRHSDSLISAMRARLTLA